MIKNKYYILYILFLFLYIFTLIFLPNDFYLNIIFSFSGIIITFLLIYYKKVGYKIVFLLNIFFVYVCFFNNINVPNSFIFNENEELKYIQLDILEGENENIIKIKNILNSNLTLNSIYNIYGIVKNNPDLDYSNLDFDINNIFEKYVSDILFDNEKSDNVLGITLFYSDIGFENYKKYFKNYLIKKYVYNQNLNGDIFKANNNIYKTFLNKRYIYNLHINEKIFESGYSRLTEIKKMIK